MVITGLTRNQLAGQPARGFESRRLRFHFWHIHMNTKNFNTNRISWIDILRGIGIILMVYGHICYSQYSYDWINSFHMAVFFFAAGYVYHKRPIMSDIKRRAYTLLIPYFSFGVLTLIFWYFIERRFKSSDESLLHAFIGLLKGQFETISFNIPLWFIPCFFLTMIIYNLLMNCCHTKHVYCLILIATAIYIFIPFQPMFWGIDKILRYMIFVATGELCAKQNLAEYILKHKKVNRILLCCILFALSLYMSTHIASSRGVWFVTATIGCAACSMLALLLEHCRPLEYLGQASMLILCIHGAVYRSLVQITIIISGAEMEFLRLNYAYALCITILTLVICAAIYTIIHKTIPQIMGQKKIR